MSNLQKLTEHIETWATELGFSACGISDIDLDKHGDRLNQWLAEDFHGEMEYLARHGSMRYQPQALHPGTQSVITVRIDYLENEPAPDDVLDTPGKSYISRYALGRDYHKTIRAKLKKLVSSMAAFCRTHQLGELDARVFTDSAPILEKALAEKAGLGWIGKNTLLMNERAGSWFFLGEILTNLPLPTSHNPQKNRCGSCRACIDICPTKAIVAPYVLDARRCISYLTIEKRGEIPEAFRKAIGNRIFGCDDCQLVCPWNRYAKPNEEPDFKPRHGLEQAEIMALFAWSEATFLEKTAGSAIRRTGYEGWLRNLAVALGNEPASQQIVTALTARKGFSDLVDEHIEWAIKQHQRSLRDAGSP